MNTRAKNTYNFEKRSLNLRGRLFEYDKPLVMGILNLTENSFYAGSRILSEQQLLETTERMLAEGADILDIGAMSTRPGAVETPAEEERGKVARAIRLILRYYPDSILSVDTYRSSVASEALDAGALIINDISGGKFDIEIVKLAAEKSTPYIIMHTPAKPDVMQEFSEYKHLIKEVNIQLAERVRFAKDCGVNDIIIDPGFGFGKTLEQNYSLLANLNYFGIHELPIIVGVSRKSMIYKKLNINPEESITGTIALNTIALLNGANILRVHDVKEAKQVVELVCMLKQE